ncbi:GRAM domain-containing protein [Sporomusa sp.]|uniref:GRAM domain-containing protein n=1 Tax=Sporomusa sp. TaxID=2078658 RepID=UPI002C299029|nr:GRAM domain-containing protein [Sporomusa sp.]HWR05590.1 GRAM domain-containing protein [Sporomusa sp.]
MYSFPLEPDETIIKKCLASYSCDGDVLNGALYLTDHRLVFVGYSLSIGSKYMDEVLLTHIKALETEKTFFVIPNVLKVITIQDKVIKIIIKGRNQWVEAINRQTGRVN